MPLDSALKELLVCPQCRGELEERDGGLVCAREGLLFPIRDGWPDMLLEEATQLPTPDAAQNASGDADSSRSSSQGAAPQGAAPQGAA